MTLAEYIFNPESKYAVIRYSSYMQDLMAQKISPCPRRFFIDDTEMAVLSLEPLSVPGLVAYVEQQASGVEFDLTLGSGKVTLLTHSKIIRLLEELEQQEQ